MELRFLKAPKFENPSMVAAWPGMGYLAKTSIDYLRRQLRAEFFAEILQYQNAIIYRDGIVDFPVIRHRFYSSPRGEIILCVGDAQPSLPEEAYSLACKVIDVAQRCNVRRIYTMAAYPDEYYETPEIFGIATNEALIDFLKEHGIEIVEGEGAINGLNGLLIGVGKTRGIEGVCLLGQIRYVNIPQIRSSKIVLETLTNLLDVRIDTIMLDERAKRMEERIRRRLESYQKRQIRERKELKKPVYIS